MRTIFLLSILFVVVLLWTACRSSKTGQVTPLTYDQYPFYGGNDLGISWSASGTVFKLWSPAAQAVRFHLYENGSTGNPLRTLDMKKGKSGVWSIALKGDMQGKYYTVQVQTGGKWLAETPDPYAKAVGVNGQRGMIIDLSKTNPAGWNDDKRPSQAAFTDIILYELHVRDLSAHINSGIKHRGKFLGLTETGTHNVAGQRTGLDHLKELGITHLHLIPVFDYRSSSVDESLPPQVPQYNWGYDPENYNVPEGSYATDAADGAVRIREFKQAIQTLHRNGIRVVMDVVYNHTGATDESVFNRVAPGYYYRQNADGKYSNASACGNETASERAMMRQYMIESLKYWVQEYHIDGFRVDLMGIHDIETMNRISAELHAIDPTIFIYGEGWTAGASPLPDSLKAIKANTHRLDRIAAFSDDFRDALKGSVFNHEERGFVSGRPGQEESIKFGIVASTKHPQVDYSKVNYSKAPWAKEPFQTITYVDCHDNHTLWDRLALSCPDASEAERIKMQELAAAMVLTSQGVSFLHAGVEMLRSKQGVENSFNSPDAINQIDWSRKTQYAAVFDYFRDLIQLRKNHPAFRMPSAEMIRTHLKFLDTNASNLLAYQITGNANGDAWKNILVIFNGNPAAKTVQLPPGKWAVVLEGDVINEKGIREETRSHAEVPGISAMILFEQ
ncbi:MAG: type I pullulanase [Saprospiraceae bacterium]|nr:type I pullulanase [Saprospiraceae bacterium]